MRLSLVLKTIALFLLVLGVEAISVNAATFVVTKTTDTNDGICNADCSLREAIVAANTAPTADAINFDPSVFSTPQTIRLNGSELEIASDTNLTINGPGPGLLTLDGDDRSRVVFIAQGAVASINGLKITHGNGVGWGSPATGGGILAYWNTTTLNNVVITGNRTDYDGGGIHSTVSGTLTIINSIISNNRAASGGGGIDVQGPNAVVINTEVSGNAHNGIMLREGSLSLQSSLVKSNTTGGNGGAIYNSYGALTITDSMLSGNTSSQGGGAIGTTNGSVSITGSSFIGNSTHFYGGGAIQSYSRLNISDSVLANNFTDSQDQGGGAIFCRQSGSTTTITRSSIIGNRTDGPGGGISNDGSGLNDEASIIITDSLISNNYAAQNGGGVFSSAGGPFETGGSEYTNTTITNNYTNAEGGGISSDSEYGVGRVTNVTISNNVARVNGGGLKSVGFMFLRNTIIANNTATTGTGPDCAGFLNSLGYNLIEDLSGTMLQGTSVGNILGVDPLLGPLANNGGPILTRALRTGSSAIDKGTHVSPTQLLHDQRGFLRPMDFTSVPDAQGGNSSDMGAFERQLNDTDHQVAVIDYDGDDRSDISVFRQSNRAWYSQRSRDGFYGALFGVVADKIVPADYDGDGRTDIAVYRPSDGIWYVLKSSNGDVAYYVFGLGEDLPTPADYDGDGKADVSVFRPSTGSWYRQNSSDGSFFGVQFGTSEDKPLVGDFDGDGKSDIAVFRPSNGGWYWINSSNGSVHGENFGFGSDVLVPADYDGDGKTDVAVFRPSDGYWYARNSSDGAFTYNTFGLSADIPAPADFDGDGKADICVFRPSDGTWYRRNSSDGSFFAVPFGTNGDKPTQTAFRY